MSMIRKCHNHTLQNNTQHHKEEAKNDNSHMISRRQYCKLGNFRENFIFASVVKDIFARLQFRDKSMIYLYQ